MIKDKSEREMKNFAYNIAWLRKEHGYSKKKMAKILNIGIGSLNKLENGEIPPRMDIQPMINVWLHFGIHPKELIETRLEK